MRIIVPSVDYADTLAVTLPAWQRAFPGAAITVVTAPHDRATQQLAAHLGARCAVTAAWYAGGRTFDKAAALDVALGVSQPAGERHDITPPNKGERCLSIDADVYPFGELPRERLNPGGIYGCARYLCPTPAHLEAHLSGRTSRRDLPLMLQRYRGADGPPTVVGADLHITLKSARACLGYFQLWRFNGQRFGSFKTGGKYDLVFRDSFRLREALEDFYVLHLGAPCRANWRGRVLPKWGGDRA